MVYSKERKNLEMHIRAKKLLKLEFAPVLSLVSSFEIQTHASSSWIFQAVALPRSDAAETQELTVEERVQAGTGGRPALNSQKG